MTAPVDLTNLRSMTDGDAEMEMALFEEFYASFEEGIANLKANTADSSAEVWRKQAHALKGIALNLGADELGSLCKQAQESPQESSQVKLELLAKINAAYAQVKQFLQAL